MHTHLDRIDELELGDSFAKSDESMSRRPWEFRKYERSFG